MERNLVLEFHVVHVTTKDIKTHAQRVGRIKNAFNSALATRSDKVFIIGQSAGGSAARIAAEDIFENDMQNRSKLGGIVMLSPAMPSGIWFQTWTLFKTMLRYLPQMFGIGLHKRPHQSSRRKNENLDAFWLARDDHSALISPYKTVGLQDYTGYALEDAEGIPAHEAWQLAFSPPGLRQIGCPVLHIWGDQDRWIDPGAQVKLNKKLSALVPQGQLQTLVVSGAGHIVFYAGCDEARHVSDTICNWITRLSL